MTSNVAVENNIHLLSSISVVQKSGQAQLSFLLTVSQGQIHHGIVFPPSYTFSNSTNISKHFQVSLRNFWDFSSNLWYLSSKQMQHTMFVLHRVGKY